MKAHIRAFDSFFEDVIGHIPKEIYGFMAVASFLGQPIVTFMIIGGIGLWGWYDNKIKLVATSAVGFAGVFINSFLKLSFGRERPRSEYVDNMWFDTFSFPSGHASGSIIAYGLLTYLAWHFLPASWAAIVTVTLVLLTILIGISRVYLGAHYASDVLGGWIIGGITLLVIILLVRPFA